MKRYCEPWYTDLDELCPIGESNETVLEHIVKHLSSVARRDSRLKNKIHKFQSMFRELGAAAEMVYRNELIVIHNPDISKLDLDTVILNMSHYKVIGERIARKLDLYRLWLLSLSIRVKDPDVFLREWKKIFNTYGSETRKRAYPEQQ